MMSRRLQKPRALPPGLLKSARFIDAFSRFYARFPQKYFLATLAAMALFGLGLALLRSPGALTIDEPTSANIAHAPMVEALAQIKNNNDAPLYPLCLKLWTKVFGESELALRGFSALCFALAIFVVGITATRLRDAFTGLVAAGLMVGSFNTGLIFASTARAYALLTLLTALTIFRFLELAGLYASKPKPFSQTRRIALFAVLLTAGLVTHPLFAFFILALVAAALLISFKFFLRIVLLAGIAMVVYLLIWSGVIVEHSRMGFPATAWMTPPELRNLLRAYLNLWGETKTILIAGLCLIFLAIAIWRERRFALRSDEKISLMLVVLCGLGVYLYSNLMTPIFHGMRTPTLFLAASCLLAASLLTRLSDRVAQWAAYALVAALMVDAAMNVYLEAKTPQPYSARISVATVLRQAKCKDVLVASGESYSEIAYYLRRLGAPTCLRFVGFPSEIERHIGWLDAFGLLEDEAALDREIGMLMIALAQGGAGAQIWLFRSRDPTYGHQQIADRLTARLDAVYGEAQALDLRGSFFDQVLIYQVK